KGFSVRDVFTGVNLDRHVLADVASSFFLTFLAVQWLAAFVVTPAYTAGAIAEEKDCKTLEFLLATDLSSREIVLSVALSRLAGLILLFLAGLPVLSLIKFMGGVDSNLLLASYAATGITLVSLTALGVLMSMYSHKPRQAILLTYVCACGY